MTENNSERSEITEDIRAGIQELIQIMKEVEDEHPPSPSLTRRTRSPTPERVNWYIVKKQVGNTTKDYWTDGLTEIPAGLGQCGSGSGRF